jgi:DNA-binding HxlR family transcriptional regulator
MRLSDTDVTMETHEIHSSECPKVSQVLARIGDKWSVLIIMMLSRGTRRFSDLKRDVEGISQRMLTMCLRGLERDGLIKRTVYPVVPPKVEYELTDLGRSLREPVMALGNWAREHIGEINEARAIFDAREE